MKRIISAILIAVLVSALAFSLTLDAAAETTAFDVSIGLPESFEQGETVELTLTLNKVPKDILFAIVNINFTGLEFAIKGKNQVDNIEVKNADAKVLDFCIINDEGQLSFTLNGVDYKLTDGAVFTVKAKILSGAKEATAGVDTASSTVYAGNLELKVNAASAKSVLGPDADVVIDIDTTDWTYVDGKTNGTWQTALDTENPEPVGTYYYKAEKVYYYDGNLLGGINSKYVIEIVFKGELSGTAESFGDGNGTNVRIWFHSASNNSGTEQLTYNTVADFSYNGSDIVSRLATNSLADGNEPNWVVDYDAVKPYTVESIIPTAKDGLYLKITFGGIMNIVDNNDVEAVITVSNKSGNALDSNKHADGAGPWTAETWADSDTTIRFFSEEAPYEPSSDEPAEELSDSSYEETYSSAAPSEEQPSAVPSTTESSNESGGSAPIIIVFVILLALVGAIAAFAMKKFR